MNGHKTTSITSQIIYRIHMLPLFQQKRDVQKVNSLERCYTYPRWIPSFQPHKQEVTHTGLKKKSQYQHHVSWTDWLEHTELLNLLFPITPWSLDQFNSSPKENKENKHYHHHLNKLATKILPEMDSNRTL
jgi:hypothetical protein